MTDKRIEAAAKAIYESDPESGFDPERPEMRWASPDYRPETWDQWRRMAKGALSAAAAQDTAEARELVERLRADGSLADFDSAIALLDDAAAFIERVCGLKP